jgi:hypothetical protein
VNVSQEVLAVLDAGMCYGTGFELPPGQLDRKLYLDVDKVLQAAGGKWNRKSRMHVFEGDAVEAIEPVLLTGTVVHAKQEFDDFPTPQAVAERVCTLAGLSDRCSILEPSAGAGALVKAVGKWAHGPIDCVEVQERHCAKLMHLDGVDRWWMGDFLACDPRIIQYDRIIMNPPFSKRNDIHHTTHAMLFLKPGGRLVSVVSAGVIFRQDILTKTFRGVIYESGGDIIPLPPASFKESGTMATTAIVTYNRRSTR